MSLYSPNRRIQRDTILLWLIIFAVLTVLARAFYVQIIQSDFLQSEGNKRQIRSMDIPAPRGEIFDRHGAILALSTPVASIWCDPKILTPYLKIEGSLSAGDTEQLKIHSVKDVVKMKQKLVKYHKLMVLLGIQSTAVTAKILSNSSRRFMYLKRSVLPTLADKIDDLNLPGVYVQDEYKRYYPAGETTAHLVGFTDIDGHGLAGIEYTYNSWLHGKNGRQQIIKDRAGHVVDFIKDVKVAKPGGDVTLSIDKDLQYFLERALKRTMIKHQAKSASSVILDAKTGEVLGLVNLPVFNPNDRSQLRGRAIRNRAVTDVMEPGSTVKPFVIALALDEEVLTREEKIDTSPGVITIQGKRITDTKNKGILTPAQIIEKSSNVGIVKVALRMDAERLWTLYQDLGFAQDLGTFLPGEATGFMKEHQAWLEVEHASASFGYGFNINLLQLAKAYTVFSNGGRVLPISLLKKEPNKLEDTSYEETNQAISETSAKTVLAMMERVVNKGTAPQARIEGYRVAGKTGTSHITDGHGAYEENEYNSLFAGLVPASNPKFIMVTIVNEPARGIYYGGSVAAPVFKEVMQEALRIYNVPTDAVKH